MVFDEMIGKSKSLIVSMNKGGVMMKSEKFVKIFERAFLR